MSTLSLDELLELARRMRPESKWFEVHGTAVSRTGCEFPESKLFAPSVANDAADWQAKQALGVIVAALKLPEVVVSLYGDKSYCITFDKSENESVEVDGVDILTAAARAVLANGGKQ